MQDYRELAIWRRAHGVVLRVYELSKTMPQSESFGLTLNLRRSAVGVASRIAEGAGRDTNSEFAGEVKRARAKNFEPEY